MSFPRRQILFAVSFLAAVVILNCSSTKGSNYETGSPELSGANEPVFPHKVGWENPERHGRTVRYSGMTDTVPCAGSCHGENLEGGIGPSCKKCHADWPHATGWFAKDGHGKFAIENGKSRCATKCHGADLSGGLADVSCTSCHAVYPHSDSFKNAEEHGPLAEGLKRGDCVNCHDDNFCKGCHNGLYPHETYWGTKEQHGAWVTSNGKDACATKCHGTDLAGGLSEVSCDDCHTLWPSQHEADSWSETGHGEKSLDLGKASCTSCHATENTCSECHQSLPSHWEENWKETHGNDALTDLDGCKKCHGGGFEGTSQTPACSTCHDSYPAKHLSDTWSGYEGHGKSDITECQACHGSDLTGGTTGISCYTCHKTYPHPMPGYPDWESETGHEHGGYFLANEDKDNSTCAKANCHGINLEGNTAAGAPACGACHLKMPHTASWDHGLAAVNQLNECKKCHGADLKGNGGASSCYKCHSSYPEPHKSENWTTAFAGHGQYIMTEESTDLKETCKTCHGTDFTGGVSGKTCYDAACHPKYPHNASWDGSEHGAYLDSLGGNIYSQISWNCATSNCHGAEGVTTWGVPSCADAACHSTFPDKHQDADTWEGDGEGGHRAFVLANGTAECEKCHLNDAIWDCSSCHTEYPHAAEPEHSEEVLTKNDKFSQSAFDGKCKDCHGETQKLNSQFPPVAGIMPSSLKRCYNEECHVVYPHIGYKDTNPVNGVLIDSPSWKSTQGHRTFLYYNEEYCNMHSDGTNMVCDKSQAELEAMLKASPDKGCWGNSDGICHKNIRHGKKHTFGKNDQFCKAVCHDK